MPKYKVVIFDFDDTLMESRVAKWNQHKHVAKTFYDINLTDETLMKHWGKPIHILASEIYEHKDSWENMQRRLMSTKKDFPKKPYTKSQETIRKLLDLNIKIAVLSAANKIDIVEDFELHGFPIDQIMMIQGAEDTKVHKPDPDVFTNVFNKLKEKGIEKKDIVYVGDSLDDLKAASGAGIDFVALTTGLYSEEDFKKNGAKKIVKDIQEILKEII